MRAWSLIRKQPHYRREAFDAGLRAVGYQLVHGVPDIAGRTLPASDVLLIWNRYAEVEQIADRFEKAGGTVLVAENGYLGAGGGTPKFEVAAGPQAGHYYALARRGHNGSGSWPQGGPERFERLGVELKPMRSWTADGHILVCPNRVFGMRGFVMPGHWGEATAETLRRRTGRKVILRPHPGNGEPRRPLTEDLKGAYACVIWASSAGVHALVEGVPVVCCAPWWICKGAADAALDSPGFNSQQYWAVMREAALHGLAWAQWTIEEIASGVPFRHLLRHTWQAQGAAAL